MINSIILEFKRRYFSFVIHSLSLGMLVFPIKGLCLEPLSNLKNKFSSSYYDEVQFLPYGGPALAQYIDAIKNAQESIDLTYFIFSSCDASVKTLIKLLQEKASHVKIRILLDSYTINGKYKQYLYENFKKSNIEVKFFNQPHQGIIFEQSLTDLIRSHHKFLIVDPKSKKTNPKPIPKLISGGRNMSDDYFGLSNNFNWIDQDILVKGTLVKKAEAYFEALWNSSYSTSVPTMLKSQEAQDFKKSDFDKWCWQPDEKVDKILAEYPNQLEIGNKKNPPVMCPVGNFFADVPQYTESPKLSTNIILKLLKETQSELDIFNYSYLPSWELRTELLSLPERGVNIEIISNRYNDEYYLYENSAKQMEEDRKYFAENHKEGFGNYNIIFRQMFKDTNQIWLKGYGETKYSIHAKTWVSDRKTVLVGSFNIDPRSYHTNGESGIVISNCPELAEQVLSYFESVKLQIEQAPFDNYKPPKPKKTEETEEIIRDWILSSPIGSQFL